MATKTFKIGLSNTDKQNMAQDVYERVLALTFPEYDSAEEYNVGDFVVYNDQLYKCIGATTGEWDSTKWQLATLNDLVNDIEGAVAFVNNKANVDGNYPTMTVGEADNLTPYDEEAGAEQNKPFLFQATGTANGTDPDFVTGSAALMREKRGNTVVVNQKLSTTHFANLTSGASTLDGFNTISGHKYIIIQNYSRPSAYPYGDKDYQVYIYGANLTSQYDINVRGYFIYEPNANSVANFGFGVYSEFGGAVTIDIYVVDLTQWFNGNIPQDLLDHPNNFFRYYQGSLAYNEGTLVNANGRYIKCIGRQQWDEEWEQGYLDSSGQSASSNDYIRSKNYIKVIPNCSYYLKSPYASYVFYYDKDKNFISSEYMKNYNFTIPSNCCFLKFHANSSTYNHDITISIYYDYESGYYDYYIYEVLTNNDTGTEVLRSAGSVADIKLPSGEIKRNVGTYTFTGSESWNADETRWFTYIDGIANVSSGYWTVAYIVSNGIVCRLVKEDHTLRVYLADNPQLTSSSDMNALFPSGTTINFALETPTTEQGTSFSENLAIHDFGTMDFSGTNGVPQGNAIFYPVDYKAYLDTLHKYTEGDPDNLALKSDLASDKSELQGVDAQLKEALGGTLRQCLCVKESLDFDDTAFVDLGTLNWNKNTGSGEENTLFYANVSEIKQGTTNLICSLLKTFANSLNFNNLKLYLSDKSIACAVGESLIAIRNDTIASDTVDQFKASLKGVLLAYEKASE